MNDRNGHPVGGVDYPRTIQEFDAWFASEEACATYLQQLRCPSGLFLPVMRLVCRVVDCPRLVSMRGLPVAGLSYRRQALGGYASPVHGLSGL